MSPATVSGDRLSGRSKYPFSWKNETCSGESTGGILVAGDMATERTVEVLEVGE